MTSLFLLLMSLIIFLCAIILSDIHSKKKVCKKYEFEKIIVDIF